MEIKAVKGGAGAVDFSAIDKGAEKKKVREEEVKAQATEERREEKRAARRNDEATEARKVDVEA